MAMDFDQALSDYYDYADYWELASVTRAKSFVTACIRLLGVIDSGTKFGDEVRLPNKTAIEKARQAAIDFIDATNTTGPLGGNNSGFVATDLRNYRD